MLSVKTIDYLRSTLPEKKTWEKVLEEEALKHNIPIMESESMAFVKQLIRIKQPATILEIGTAIGYSALEMSDAYPSSKIVTIERDENRYLQAKKNIQAMQKSDHIDVILGDALELLPDFDRCQFDVIFIDA
ncbi:MAG TPA: class I SAM-dependent methyltransferase, partial [Bacillota bacterium]|nr:class I SAM-dependent methyltransferase [Bacillota bacterium]